MENNEQQQLALISDMINIARKEYSDDSYIYLLWGWSVTIACLTEYVLYRMGKSDNGMVWAILMPLAAILQITLSIIKSRKMPVKTHMDRIIGRVWLAVGVCIGIVVASMNILQFNTYPVLILLYGIGTFISASIMNFTPMKIGAVCCWVIGIVTFHVQPEYQLLLLPLSLILSYIIPGHLLKARFSKNV